MPADSCSNTGSSGTKAGHAPAFGLLWVEQCTAALPWTACIVQADVHLVPAALNTHLRKLWPMLETASRGGLHLVDGFACPFPVMLQLDLQAVACHLAKRPHQATTLCAGMIQDFCSLASNDAVLLYAGLYAHPSNRHHLHLPWRSHRYLHQRIPAHGMLPLAKLQHRLVQACAMEKRATWQRACNSCLLLPAFPRACLHSNISLAWSVHIQWHVAICPAGVHKAAEAADWPEVASSIEYGMLPTL